MESMSNNFCPICGCLLDMCSRGPEIKCFRRNCTFTKEREGNHVNRFSDKVVFEEKAKTVEDTLSVMSGPQIEYQCPSCNHHLATYFTRQMRSADEGQTCFYVCLKCKQVTREE